MCEFASAVLTKDHVFLGKTDSHSGIIDQHRLHESGVRGVNILKVGLVPENLSDPISEWEFRIDQDLLPDWADKARDEKRTRETIEKSGLVGVERKYQARRKPLDEEYEAKRKPLWDEYVAKRKPLDEEYEAKRKPLWDEYYAKRKPLDDEYYAKRKPLLDEYDAKHKPLWDEYEAKRKPLLEEYNAKREKISEKVY
jgi:hypothetical protein